MGGKDLEKVLTHLFVENLALVDGLKELHHLTGSGNVLAAFRGGLHVHHLSLKASLRKTLRGQEGVDVLHTNAIDQNVGGGVVADRHHHGGKIAQSDLRNAWRESTHNIAVLHEILGIHRIEVSELEF